MITTPAGLVVPRPQDVLPLAECVVPHLAKALRLGIGFADDLQPDPRDRDSWYWSHSARFQAKRHLVSVPKPDGWGIKAKTSNSAIHLRLMEIHKIRVLRSLGETVPHPGPNHARREAWMQQDGLRLNDGLPPMSLLIDWRVRDDEPDEPLFFLSMPKRPWRYRADPEVHWRVLVTGDTDHDLSKLRFDPGMLPGDVMVTVKIDPAERRTG